MDRFTVKYTTPTGRRAVLYNVGDEAARLIRARQERLGATGISVTRQPHWYSQHHISAMEQGDPLPHQDDEEDNQ